MVAVYKNNNISIAGPHSAIISSVSDFRSRGCEFDLGLAPYFHGDRSRNIFYGLSPPYADSRRAVVSCKQNYVHSTLVKHLVKLAK